MTKPVIIVLIFAFFFTCSFTVYQQLGSNTLGTETVVVQADDTLWEIAEHLGSKEDIRYVVQEIQKLNGLKDSTIYPGQELRIPASEEQLLGLEVDNNLR